MSASERQRTFPAELPSVTAGRHFARDVIAEWGLEQHADDVQLCATELVANAVRHAGTEVRMAIRKDEFLLTIEVHDGQPELHRPFKPHTDVTAESGRGLQIVAAISDDWGVNSTVDGKCIWFSLALTGSASDDADVFSLDQRRSRSQGSLDVSTEGEAREQARAAS